jgi:hypothetical protein
VETITCPQCGHADDLDGFDVLGACDCNLFCQQCHAEFDPDTGEIHKCTRKCKRKRKESA